MAQGYDDLLCSDHAGDSGRLIARPCAGDVTGSLQLGGDLTPSAWSERGFTRGWSMVFRIISGTDIQEFVEDHDTATAALDRVPRACCVPSLQYSGFERRLAVLAGGVEGPR